MKRIAWLFGMVLAWSGTAHASADRAGTTGATFLSTGTGPSALAMGGASLALRDDLGAAAWNPAALAWLPETRVVLSHANLESSQSQEWLSFGGRAGHGGTRWSANALYQGEGGFNGRDASNQATGDFGVSSSAVGLTVGRSFGANLAAGLGAKYIHEDLAGVTGSGMGFDAGVQASAGAFAFGAAARNVGGSMKYSGTSWSLPSNVGAGVAWSDPAHGLRLAVDANFPSAYYNDVRAGVEWRWEDRFALRGGYRADLGGGSDDRLAGPTFGFGTGANGLWLDYAMLAGSNGAAASHRIGLTLRPSQWMNWTGGLASQSNDGEDAQPVAKATPAPKPAKAPKVRKEKPAKPAAEAPVAAKPAKAAKAQATAASPAAEDAAPMLESAKPAKPVKQAKVKPERPAPAPKPAKLPKTPKPVPSAPAVVPTPAFSVPSDANTSAEPADARKKSSAKQSLAPGAPAKAVAMSPVPEEPATPEAAKPAPPAAEPVKPQPAKPEPARAQPAREAPTPDAVVPAVTPKSKPQKRPATITVKEGETLADLAERWETSVPALMMENNLVRESVAAGRKLRLPPPSKP